MLRVCCAIIQKKGKVLIVRRSHTMSNAYKWEFPGGKIESRESESQCIVREIKEELGVTITELNKLPEIIHIYPDKELCLIPFKCIIEHGEITLHEHSHMKWVTPSELNQHDLSDADKKIIELL